VTDVEVVDDEDDEIYVSEATMWTHAGSAAAARAKWAAAEAYMKDTAATPIRNHKGKGKTSDVKPMVKDDDIVSMKVMSSSSSPVSASGSPLVRWAAAADCGKSTAKTAKALQHEFNGGGNDDDDDNGDLEEIEDEFEDDDGAESVIEENGETNSASVSWPLNPSRFHHLCSIVGFGSTMHSNQDFCGYNENGPQRQGAATGSGGVGGERSLAQVGAAYFATLFWVEQIRFDRNFVTTERKRRKEEEEMQRQQQRRRRRQRGSTPATAAAGRSGLEDSDWWANMQRSETEAGRREACAW
jgi:hypothetical protein